MFSVLYITFRYAIICRKQPGQRQKLHNNIMLNRKQTANTPLLIGDSPFSFAATNTSTVIHYAPLHFSILTADVHYSPATVFRTTNTKYKISAYASICRAMPAPLQNSRH
jgi:hypothetical protein